MSASNQPFANVRVEKDNVRNTLPFPGLGWTKKPLNQPMGLHGPWKDILIQLVTKWPELLIGLWFPIARIEQDTSDLNILTWLLLK